MCSNKRKLQLSAASGPFGRIRRAHLSMQRCADAVFSPCKITTDQCSLLWSVWRREGIRQTELAVELFTDANTVTAMLVRMEKRGLVKREVCTEDARARRVSLTAAGRRLITRLNEDWTPMRRKLQEIFSSAGGLEAMRILEEVRAVMTHSREEILESRKKRSARSSPSKPSTSPVVVELQV
jgi:DNA-binding MarR family transcriptional regulator